MNNSSDVAKKVFLTALLLFTCSESASYSKWALESCWITMIVGVQAVLKKQRHSAIRITHIALNKFEDASASKGIKDDRGELLAHRLQSFKNELSTNIEKYALYRSVLYGGGSVAAGLGFYAVGVPLDMEYADAWVYAALMTATGMTGLDGYVLNPRQIKDVRAIEDRAQRRMDKVLGDTQMTNWNIHSDNQK
jgi:hypothetical protein